ncbi:hypothetical protein B0A48_14698 [Cryoendolithus antarcticus]|uniref:Uncharacterized protein n=1 Tax=Cryoendolithus antarcticus TaxID=1507870 RepID=A0A1V8SK76_9PEZI|nr:hypothetical protein B0A48_14698 [Cryoendolithus antarcticus]
MSSPSAQTSLARRTSSVYSQEVDEPATPAFRPRDPRRLLHLQLASPPGSVIIDELDIAPVEPGTLCAHPAHGPYPVRRVPTPEGPPLGSPVVRAGCPTPDCVGDEGRFTPPSEPHPGSRVPTPEDPRPPSPVARAGNPTPDRASSGRREPFPPFAWESYPEVVFLPPSPEPERRGRVKRLKGWLRRVLTRDFGRDGNKGGEERGKRRTRPRPRGRGKRVGVEEGYVPMTRLVLGRMGLGIRGLVREGMG